MYRYKPLPTEAEPTSNLSPITVTESDSSGCNRVMLSALFASKRLVSMLILAVLLVYGGYHVLVKNGGGQALLDYGACPPVESGAGDSSMIMPQGTNDEAFIRKRLDTAEEIWKRSVEVRHEAMEETDLPESLYQRKMARFFWDFFYATFDCPYFIERIGRVGDGGKWVCGFDKIVEPKPDKTCIVYSFGISNEVTFEEEILTRTAEGSGNVPCYVRMFDPTIDPVKKPNAGRLVKKFGERAKFHALGIGAKSDQKMRTLADAMADNGDNWIDIMKIDVEGHEFKSLTKALADFDGQLPIGQLQIEIHLSGLKVPKNEVVIKFTDWYEALEDAGLRAFHREANYVPMLNGQAKGGFISLFEYSFVNVKQNKNKILHG